MPPKIRGGTVGTVAALRKSLKNKSAGYTARVPADSSLTVRYLTEPEHWVEFFSHYDKASNTFGPCTESCDFCFSGNKPSKRYLANAVDVAENKVVALEMPQSLADSVLKKYDKYGTLLDRDYELIREGSGQNDTKYDSIPESPSKMNLRRYELKDLMKVLESQLETEDEEDEEEKPLRRPMKKAAASRRAPATETRAASTRRVVPAKKVVKKAVRRPTR